MIIYSVHKEAQGLGRFLMLMRQSGNPHSLDPDTQKFEIFSRKDDAHYGEHPDVMIIRQEEIGPAIEELEGQNTPEQLNGFKRPQSLADILSMRKIDPAPVEAVAQPYHEDDDAMDPADMEGDDIEDPSEIDPENEDGDDGDVEDPTDRDDSFESEHLTAEEEQAVHHETAPYVAADIPAVTALQEAAQTISNAKKDRILKVVQETLGTDLTDVSDILLMLSETADLKKALSTILSLLNIEVSMTAVSQDYKVTPKTIRFAAGRTESLENYRRGVAQAMVRINEILEALNKTEDLEKTIKMLESNLDMEKRNAATQAARAQEEIQALQTKLSPRALIAARFLIFWKSENNQTVYLTVQPGAKSAVEADKPLEYGTKKCGATMKQSESHKFTSLESAENQVTRLTKWSKNCAFFEGGVAPKLSIARLGLDIVG